VKIGKPKLESQGGREKHYRPYLRKIAAKTRPWGKPSSRNIFLSSKERAPKKPVGSEKEVQSLSTALEKRRLKTKEGEEQGRLANK